MAERNEAMHREARAALRSTAGQHSASVSPPAVADASANAGSSAASVEFVQTPLFETTRDAAAAGAGPDTIEMLNLRREERELPRSALAEALAGARGGGGAGG